jgi:hypothetical protein
MLHLKKSFFTVGEEGEKHKLVISFKEGKSFYYSN